MHFITYAKKLAEHRVEFLLAVCISLSMCLIVVVTQTQQTEAGALVGSNVSPTAAVKEHADPSIYVEISGAVYKPGVYKLAEGARLYELLAKAGGLNKQAAKEFFYRNYNQARVLQDAEKIHAPSLDEVATGAFVEQPLVVYSNEAQVTIKAKADQGVAHNGSLISVNTASLSELEELPGVGKITAEKIVAGRPYTSVEELGLKGVISDSLFLKIKDLIAP